MKYLKGFAAGLLILLAVLIMIYLIPTYTKFKPDEELLETESKLSQFIEKSHFNRDYIRIAFMLSISALAGIVFKKWPAVSVWLTSLTLAFVLQLYDYGLLTKRPMVIMLFVICALGGFIALCAAYDRKRGTRSLLTAVVLTSSSALIISAICNIFEYREYSVRLMIKELDEGSLTVLPKVKAVPEFVRMIYMSFKNRGLDAARDMNYLIQRQTAPEVMKNHFLTSLSEDDFPLCAILSLVILIFTAAAAILLIKKLPSAAASASAVPVVFSFVLLQKDRLNTLPLPILILCLVSFVCFVSSRLPSPETVTEDGSLYDDDGTETEYDADIPENTCSGDEDASPQSDPIPEEEIFYS